MFQLTSNFKPAGDQASAIDNLVSGIKDNKKHQILFGATGTGKTFTVANVIDQLQLPTLVIAHNKTLAAQLTSEYREFFPHNAVEYFVSYYDYYQPEAYIANSDTFIEKEAQINDEIDRLRHAATQAVLTRKDTIIVASVSCIYGLGSAEEYEKAQLVVRVNDQLDRDTLLEKLIFLQYNRNDTELKRGNFRVRGEIIEIMPIDREIIIRLHLNQDSLVKIEEINSVTGVIEKNPHFAVVFPAKHFVTAPEQLERAIRSIEDELGEQLKKFKSEGKLLEEERLRRRTTYDLEMIRQVGYCNGIENYSRHFDGRAPNAPPNTLLNYFPKDFLIVVDESHVTIPQINGMYNGDRSRKDTLVEYGFRLPSARDNRPLKFNEFEERIPKIIYCSATPGAYELTKTENTVEQIIRPTGLVDPQLIVRPTKAQVKDLQQEVLLRVKNQERVLVTTLTKKMAEDLTGYFQSQDIKVRYLHSDVKTLERITILRDLRKGTFDVLVGVNLLREGLDLPEVSLVAILDADKEGFLRSERSLIQTIGRAARNVQGTVILYADSITESMRRAIDETNRRRVIQENYNKKHNITPQSISKNISSIIEEELSQSVSLDRIELDLAQTNINKLIKDKERQMRLAAQELQFELAAILRDEIIRLKKASSKKTKLDFNV